MNYREFLKGCSESWDAGQGQPETTRGKTARKFMNRVHMKIGYGFMDIVSKAWKLYKKR